MAIIPSHIKSIANVVKNNSSLSVKETRVGGSYKKGTMLHDSSDVDLVVVLGRKYKSWHKTVHHLYKDLTNAFPNAVVKECENIAIHITFNHKGATIDFDIVASYSVNSPLQMAEVKDSKIHQGMASVFHFEYLKLRKDIRYFSECVILLKEWKEKYNIPLESFHLELIAAHAHAYRIKNKDDYSLGAFFCACCSDIQSMIDGAAIFPVDWKYSDTNIENHYDIPVLIDPANPSENLLCNLTADKCLRIKKEATRAMSHIVNKNYGSVFDPENKTKHFDNAS
jgi:tRNA nucleotidyltransferase (CCA-adding enzyme)